jgi:ABC-2 type transport system ATP-binding protein
MDAIVQVENLCKTYGAKVAIDGISFVVHQGEIFGIVGPNGAGKTTTIECLEGLRKPDQGNISVLGMDPRRDSQALKRCVGMQLQQSNLPDRMKVWEALDLYASFYLQTADWKVLMSQLGLEEKRNTAFSKLSGGQKQRLFIALALVLDPQLIFMDELTTGLDPQARHAIWDLVRDVRSQGKTIVLTTHFMEEAERLCDRVAILDHGQIVALDTPTALIRTLETEERVVFRLEGRLPAGLEIALSQAGRIEKQGEQITISARQREGASLVGIVVSILTREGIQFQDLRTEQPSLEDVFLSLTGHQVRE